MMARDQFTSLGLPSSPDLGRDARMYPAYTTAQLRDHVSSEKDPAIRAKMLAEIEARESGASKPAVTPQTKGGLPIPRLGRM